MAETTPASRIRRRQRQTDTVTSGRRRAAGRCMCLLSAGLQGLGSWAFRLLRGRDEFLGLLGAFTEEIGFRLLDDELLVLLLPGLQAIFIEQHLHVLLPLLPGELGDVVVDFLSQLV